jgi:excisionase family DNA binding protein
MSKVLSIRDVGVSPQIPPQIQVAGVLTVPEVAKELRCSTGHVYNAINGKVSGVSALPAIGMGRRRLVRRLALEQWKQENERCAK